MGTRVQVVNRVSKTCTFRYLRRCQDQVHFASLASSRKLAAIGPLRNVFPGRNAWVNAGMNDLPRLLKPLSFFYGSCCASARVVDKGHRLLVLCSRTELDPGFGMPASNLPPGFHRSRDEVFVISIIAKGQTHGKLGMTIADILIEACRSLLPVTRSSKDG